MKKSLVLVVSIFMVLSLVLSACVQKVEEPTQAPVVEEPVEEPVVEEPVEEPIEEPEVEEPVEELGPVLKIGQIGQMSGLMALYGLQQQRGFEMGLKYMSEGKTDEQGRYIIANRPVEVIVKDDEGNAEKAVALALELIEKDGV